MSEDKTEKIIESLSTEAISAIYETTFMQEVAPETIAELKKAKMQARKQGLNEIYKLIDNAITRYTFLA
jgi:hypothetical protein